MSARRLLYLDQAQLAVYTWQRGKLSPDGLFAGTADGQRQFVNYLEEHRGCIFSLLANVADEVHRQENIPCLRSSDRQAVLQRKISQHFPGTALTATTSLGQEQGQRKNEKVLLSALTDPAHLAPWLSCLNNAAAPLAGIFTVSQLGGALLKKLGHGREPCLLLTQQDDSLRESYLVAGQTLFSRRVPLTDLSSPALARSFAEEAGVLQHYLISQRHIGRDESLPVFIIAHQQDLPAIAQTTATTHLLRFTLLDSAHVATQLGFTSTLADSRSEQLFLHLLASSPPCQQFASPAHRQDFHRTKIARGLTAASLIALLVSSIFSAQQFSQARQWAHQTQQLRMAAAALPKDLPATTSQAQPLEISREAFRHLARRHSELRDQQRAPGPALRTLSEAIEQTPAIALDTITWKISHAGRSTATNIDSGVETTTLSGKLHDDNTATQRQLLATLTGFVDTLRRNPGATVKIVQSSVDLNSEQPLRGGDRETEAPPSSRFVIDIMQKLTP